MNQTAAENRGMANRPTKARRREKREPPQYFIGEWIRALGARPRDVAKGANVNEGYLSQLISGEKKNPGPGLLLDIAKYLDIKDEALKRPPPPAEVIEQTSGIDPSVLARLRRQ